MQIEVRGVTPAFGLTHNVLLVGSLGVGIVICKTRLLIVNPSF